jgi:hypothetical protein
MGNLFKAGVQASLSLVVADASIMLDSQFQLIRLTSLPMGLFLIGHPHVSLLSG